MLSFTGKSGSSPEFELLLEAYAGQERVVVVTSREALDDFGLAKVQARASEKYDAGQLDEKGRVRVFSDDM